MAASPYIEQYTRTFTSYSGADIVATFNGRVIAELQQITYSVRREKAPVYTMGSPNPRCFARGKRGIAGTLIFTSFNRDALLSEMRRAWEKLPSTPSIAIYKADKDIYGLDKDLLVAQYRGIEDWDEIMTKEMATNEQGFIDNRTLESLTTLLSPEDFDYADQLFPFNVTISFKNEYGNRSRLDIIGVEILNESSGMGIDDLAIEKVYTFIALGIKPMRPVGANAVSERSSAEDRRSAGTMDVPFSGDPGIQILSGDPRRQILPD